jgi:WD40 repeat protein
MGSKLVSASSDRTARVYNVTTGNCISVLHGINIILGHDGEVSKANFKS